jgi:hypothetical protein
MCNNQLRTREQQLEAGMRAQGMILAQGEQLRQATNEQTSSDD